MKIYVAGPMFSSGQVDRNTLDACEVGKKIMDAGHTPFVPHLNLFWDRAFPRHNEESWLQWDFAWLDCCQALVYLPGYSRGTEREIDRAICRGMEVIPLRDLDAWLFRNPVKL